MQQKTLQCSISLLEQGFKASRGMGVQDSRFLGIQGRQTLSVLGPKGRSTLVRQNQRVFRHFRYLDRKGAALLLVRTFCSIEQKRLKTKRAQHFCSLNKRYIGVFGLKIPGKAILLSVRQQDQELGQVKSLSSRSGQGVALWFYKTKGSTLVL